LKIKLMNAPSSFAKLFRFVGFAAFSAVICLLSGGVSRAQFTGPYDVSNWTTTISPVFSDGAVDLSGAPASILLIGPDGSRGQEGPGQEGPFEEEESAEQAFAGMVDFTTIAHADGTVFFRWDYETFDSDGSEYDPFGFLFNGEFTQLTVDGFFDPQAGTYSRWIPAGTQFGFRQASTDLAEGRGVTQVSLFSFVVAAPAGGGGGSGKPSGPVLVTDVGAIQSLLGTGLVIPLLQRQALQNAANGAIRDLNSRLFRARNRAANSGGSSDDDEDGVVAFESTTDASMIGYLNLAASQNIDYRVALGLRDGVEVAYGNDSLSQADVVWASSPFALAGGPFILATGSAVVAAPLGAATGGKESATDKVVIGEPAGKRYEVFAEFDYGFYDQDALSDLARGFDSDTYAGSVGAEYRVFPWLHVGGAFSYLENNTDLSSGLGGVDLDGTLLTGYFTAFWRQFYLDFLYSYGDFQNQVSRDTLLGRTARGDTDSYLHNIDVNLGHNYRLSDQIVAGPFAGLNYSTGGIDAYRERNGGPANLIYPADDFESTIGRLGWHLSYTTKTPLGRVTAQGRAGWAHQFTPEADTVQASLAASPFVLINGNRATRVGGFTAEKPGAHAGTDWLEIGASLRFDLDERWNLQFDYEGQFARQNAEAHFGSLKLEYEWD
jgi:uncharacterized protein YhjY with autotransporter beta-barrel domain